MHPPLIRAAGGFEEADRGMSASRGQWQGRDEPVRRPRRRGGKTLMQIAKPLRPGIRRHCAERGEEGRVECRAHGDEPREALVAPPRVSAEGRVARALLPCATRRSLGGSSDQRESAVRLLLLRLLTNSSPWGSRAPPPESCRPFVPFVPFFGLSVGHSAASTPLRTTPSSRWPSCARCSRLIAKTQTALPSRSTTRKKYALGSACARDVPRVDDVRVAGMIAAG